MATLASGALVQSSELGLTEFVLGATIIVVLVAGAAWQAYLLRTRRRVTEALRDSERRFRLLAENGVDMIWLYDEGFRAIYVSPASQRVLGYAPDELLGRSLADLGHPDDLVALRSDRQRFENQGYVTSTARFRHRDGHWVWIEATGKRVDNDADGVRTQVVARDITERVEAEQELCDEQERSRVIIDSASDPYLSTDSEGIVNDWNRSAESTFGWPRAEIIGRRAIDVLGLGENRELEARRGDQVRAGLADAATLPYQTTARHHDGRVIPIEASMWSVGDGDRLTYNVLLRDVTRRVEIERELTRARERAVEASRLKSEFLATMSHEIRTPMNGVIGLSGLLMDTPLEPRQRRFAEGIGVAASSLLAVINDILDFSKLEAGKVVLDEVDFDPGQLVEGVVALMAEPARDRDLELLGFTDPYVAAPLRGDAGRLRQILINLTANAIKFTSTGEVVVRIDRAAQGTAPAGTEAVRLSVRDTGIGISAEDQTRMFEPFAQHDASSTRRHGGSGLGLTICRQIVEAMGGRIGVSSELGHGSTFWCEIPLSRATGENPAATSPEAATLEGLQVLIVDDNETNRLLLRTQTQAWRMTPYTAASGPQALDSLRDAARHGRPCDLAILDLAMPDMDGMELAQRIAADPDIPFVHKILLTSGAVVNMAAAREVGISASLTKPVQQSQLYESIANVLAADAQPMSDASNPAPDVEAGARTGIRRLLVAEDNDINQQVATGLLEPLGYQVDLADDGAQALEMAARRRYDAVLMDCQMPTLDGYEASRRLRREQSPNRDAPIIALTASARAEDRDRCLAAGMSDYLSKPVTRDALISVLDRWIGSGPAEPSPPAPAPAPAPAPPAPAPPFVPSGSFVASGSSVPSVEGTDDGAAIADRLEQISGGDAAAAPMVRRLVESFLQRVPADLDRLAETVDHGEAAEVAAQAHRLKGTSLNLGAQSLAERSAALETAAREGRIEHGQDLVAEARAGFATAERLLREQLSGWSDPTPDTAERERG